jgi:UPF0716 protein FxsA
VPDGYPNDVPILFVLFVVVPLVELYVMIQVGQEIGALRTVALLVAVSVVGAWLAKREGLSVWRRMRAQISAGQVPAAHLVDGALILLGGVLLLTPGFVTDVLGLVLLLPPTRVLVRRVLRNAVFGRVEAARNLARGR